MPQAQSDLLVHSIPPMQPPVNSTTSFRTPSTTSNTELLEGISKQALVSSGVDELPSMSSPEQTNSIFDAASSLLTYTSSSLTAASINCYQQTHPNIHLTSNSSTIHFGTPIHEHPEIEHDSISTAPTSLNKDFISPRNDSPHDVPPIFRNVLHVAIVYGKYRTGFDLVSIK